MKPVLTPAQYSQVEKINGPTCPFTWLGIALIATPWIIVGGALIKFYLF